MADLKPNNKCPCGSGKKYRACCLGKRSREMSLVFQVPEKTTIDGFMMEPNGQVVLTFQGKPVRLSSAETELSYSRKKGRKVLMRGPTSLSAPSINPNLPFLSYHGISAIDTNTIDLNREKISVGCVVNCLRKRENGVLTITSIPTKCIELRNVRGDQERVMWKVVCKAIMDNPQFDMKYRFGIIVDSSLDSINRINSRTEAIVGDWFLPETFTLIYASADSATDTIGNHLIRQCDMLAAKLLQKIKVNPNPSTLHPALPNEPYSHIRNWSWNVSA